MAYTLTQARPLLNAAELELFDHSRAEPIKALTASHLAGKVKSARTLRDKYRDLYRRQTVATQAEDAASRSATGGDNERTQRKADIFQEVLERFEARSTLLQTRSARDEARTSAAAKPATADKKTAAQTKATADHSGGAPERSDKARSRQAPTAAGKAHAPQINAPLDTVPAAERASPLKQNPGNIAIQAHLSSSTRRAQGKRDSR